MESARKCLLVAAAIVWISPGAGAQTVSDPKLTPGAVATTDLSVICGTGFAKAAERTSFELKETAYRRYRMERRTAGHCDAIGGCEINHLIPLELGGADVVENLWPQRRSGPWNVLMKVDLEHRMYRLVCAHRLPIAEAQSEIAHDWIAAYEVYIGMGAPW